AQRRDDRGGRPGDRPGGPPGGPPGDRRGGGPDDRGSRTGTPPAGGVDDDPRARATSAEARTYDPAPARLEARRIPAADDGEDATPEIQGTAWGTDDDGPAPAVVLAADLPSDAPADDFDPLTYPLVEGPGATLGDDVASVAGVRFVPGGRVQWFEAGDADYAIGDRVMVDAERGSRLGVIAVAPARKPTRGDDARRLRRVIRRASDQDLRGERDGDGDRANALRIAKDKAAALRLPLKVFRVEVVGQLGRNGKLNVYYTSDERIDVREFIRDVGNAVGARIELRQLGVRDEAKAVGGIGSCGLTLCCTTWLPDFVPVSIKMAKDQGLVLSPTKVSGQCGRLKCCLVYEQAAYAELRKGLPKLGKRVLATRGEGRVVEVDVLRQRVRVSYGAGDTEVLPAADVKALFPSASPSRAPSSDPSGDSSDRDPSREPSPDPSSDPTSDPTGDRSAAGSAESEDGGIDVHSGDDPSAMPGDDPPSQS
nr:hypothetical protein [Myxococcota bacterium]